MAVSLRSPSPARCAFVLLLATLSACERTTPAAPPRTAATPPTTAAGIDWNEGHVEKAFEEAQKTGKPVLLYWGAIWCPPCNRLKTTTFKDPAFITQTRRFVAVHLDGDQEEAQRWGERFAVKGYPTILLLRPDRSEITRLIGDTTTAQLIDSLRAAAQLSSSTKQLLDMALKNPASLKQDDWALLAGYSWLHDNQLVDAEQASVVLASLAKTAPQPALQRQFGLLAVLANRQKPVSTPATRALLQAVIADPADVRTNLHVLVPGAATLVASASDDARARASVSEAFNRALAQAYADPTLPIVDRLRTAFAVIALARLSQGQPEASEQDGPQPPLPADVIETVHQRVHWAVATAKTPEERQSTIESAVDLLVEVGDNGAAEQLLLAELGRSKTPSYYMPYLGHLAEERGDNKTALSWFKKAYATPGSEGTLVQRGVPYLDAMIRLNPDDAAGIEALAGQVIGDLAKQPDGYLRKNRRHFDPVGASLQAWSKQHHAQGSAVLERLRQKAQATCGSRTDCVAWLG
ncbi:thioredoxin family protein [Xanthomonas floridensis]|uniref:Dihydroneopterin aldolase n=1 Tax=Xanthomonas floridensis TaxID=1843580 RepID=A0A1A9MFC8_9XANT|nr:thioredoxin family protein [Xanthomonas floridensis]MEA5124686.1 thioredoxin family protein [Xanthomonas floridensis]MEA5132281.1 thioredoxin family protein [Xanthomonas floridensis]OAG68546.1 dihydroneopterin aldolase [Xanthomonas floridensis]